MVSIKHEAKLKNAVNQKKQLKGGDRLKVFTVNLEEKDYAALKIAAKEWFDDDGRPWPTGRLVRHILSDWLSSQVKKKKVLK